jgi:hypothetical protein
MEGKTALKRFSHNTMNYTDIARRFDAAGIQEDFG